MLNKHNLNIAALCSKEDSRFSLNSIQVTRDYTAETDGHQLMMVTRPKVEEGMMPDPELNRGFAMGAGQKDFLLPASVALELSKKLPRKPLVPVFENAVVQSEGKSPDAVLAYADKRGDIQTMRSKKPEGTFPDFQRIMPKVEASTFQIGLNVQLLKGIAAQFVSFLEGQKTPAVRCYFKSATEAVLIEAENEEGQKMTAVLMPCRWEDIPNSKPVTKPVAAPPPPVHKQFGIRLGNRLRYFPTLKERNEVAKKNPGMPVFESPVARDGRFGLIYKSVTGQFLTWWQFEEEREDFVRSSHIEVIERITSRWSGERRPKVVALPKPIPQPVAVSKPVVPPVAKDDSIPDEWKGLTPRQIAARKAVRTRMQRLGKGA